MKDTIVISLSLCKLLFSHEKKNAWEISCKIVDQRSAKNEMR